MNVNRPAKKIIIDGCEYTTTVASALFTGVGRKAIETAVDIRTEWTMSDLHRHSEKCRADTRRKRVSALKQTLNRRLT